MSPSLLGLQDSSDLSLWHPLRYFVVVLWLISLVCLVARSLNYLKKKKFLDVSGFFAPAGFLDTYDAWANSVKAAVGNFWSIGDFQGP